MQLHIGCFVVVLESVVEASNRGVTSLLCWRVLRWFTFAKVSTCLEESSSLFSMSSVTLDSKISLNFV